MCLHHYYVLHLKQGFDIIFPFQIILHMGRKWGLYGHTHMGLPSHTPYGANMGFIWAYPHGTAQSHPIWGQYGVHMGIPTWDCPVTPHMGPIWGSNGHTHMGLPSHTPYGANMGFKWAYPHGTAQSHPIWGHYGVHMGMPIWACPVTPIWDQYGVHMGMPICACSVTPCMGPIWCLYGRAHLGLPSCSPYGTHIVVFAGLEVQLFNLALILCGRVGCQAGLRFSV